MIGVVTAGSYRAEMLSRHEWRVSVGGEVVDSLGANLADYYSDERWYSGPADGRPGAMILSDLAGRMGGEVEMAPQRETEGVIY